MTLLADAVLACLLLEAAALAVYHWRTGRGPAPAALAATLLAGAGLVLALRIALRPEAPGLAIAACLALALAGHVADLRLRWPRARADRPSPHCRS